MRGSGGMSCQGPKVRLNHGSNGHVYTLSTYIYTRLFLVLKLRSVVQFAHVPLSRSVLSFFFLSLFPIYPLGKQKEEEEDLTGEKNNKS